MEETAEEGGEEEEERESEGCTDERWEKTRSSDVMMVVVKVR